MNTADPDVAPVQLDAAPSGDIGWKLEEKRIYSKRVLDRARGEDQQLFRDYNLANAEADLAKQKLLDGLGKPLSQTVRSHKGAEGLTFDAEGIMVDDDGIPVTRPFTQQQLTRNARIGALSVINNYDPSRDGHNFAAAVQRAVERTITSPVAGLYEVLKGKLDATAKPVDPEADRETRLNYLKKLHRRQPDAEELAEEAGLNLAQTEAALLVCSLERLRQQAQDLLGDATDLELAEAGEVRLAQMQLAIGKLGNKRRLTELEERQQLLKLHRANHKIDRIKQRLLEGVGQYVLKVAKSYLGRGVELEDLVQEGRVGVLTAIDKFEPKKGFAFLTYADDWIRQRMSRACTDKGSIEKHGMRLPCHMYMTVGRVSKFREPLHDQLGREPTPAELARQIDRSAKQVEDAQTVLGRSLVSIDAHWSHDDSEVSIGEAIADEQAPDPIGSLAVAEHREAIWNTFLQLTQQEQEVFAMREALEVPSWIALRPEIERGRKYTQEEVCAMLDIKKSKMISLHKKAKSKLGVSDVLSDIADDVLSSAE